MRKALWDKDSSNDGTILVSFTPETADEHKLIEELTPWAKYIRRYLSSPVSIRKIDFYDLDDFSVRTEKGYEIVADCWLIRPDVQGSVFIRRGDDWQSHRIRTNPYAWVAMRLDEQSKSRNSGSNDN